MEKTIYFAVSIFCLKIKNNKFYNNKYIFLINSTYSLKKYTLQITILQLFQKIPMNYLLYRSN